MKTYSRQDVRDGLSWPVLIAALRQAFREGCTQPVRQHLDVGTAAVPGDLLIMPAWQEGGHVGVKLVTVFRGNAALGLPAIASTYTLFDGRTGVLLAQIDGGELTARRTAAASVLAAGYLARPDSRTLVMLGTGRVAQALAQAYCATFPIETLIFCGRDPDRTARTAEAHRHLAAVVEAGTDVPAALGRADIVSAATLSKAPLIEGRFLRPGTHVDLVGGFRPDMREADDAAMRMAVLFVDTFPGATKEAGDIVQPLQAGVIAESDLCADLAMLCKGDHPGRTDAKAVTLFKSVGAALEDLAGAVALVTGGEGRDAG